MTQNPPPNIQERMPLAGLTTIGLGGPARYYARCASIEEIAGALAFGREAGVPTHVLGGGSNVLFPDEGYNGLVLHINLSGVEKVLDGPYCLVSAAAGEPWDRFVETCVEEGLQGIECLSGIPGQVGATPIQNVGAYGQEVSDSIVRVSALDSGTMDRVEFSAEECSFGYRRSRFKEGGSGRFVITRVLFKLRINGKPEVRYPELQHELARVRAAADDDPGAKALAPVRRAVLNLRRRKSMVVDAADPHSKSVGSFFMNPIVSHSEYESIALTATEAIPKFPAPDGVKVPAAWLVEHAGFPRGYRRGGVGISAHHALALVNYGGSTSDVLALAADIRAAVFGRFSIRLREEPVVVENPHPQAPA